MPLIKDKNYREFIDTGIITPVEKPEFDTMLANVKYKEEKQARALMILLFWSGCRPSEALELTGAAFKKKGSTLSIMMPTKKEGRARLIYLPLNDHIKELATYANGHFPNQYIFWSFRKKTRNTVKKKLKNGETKIKVYERSTSTITRWVKRWTGITPYFFRHSRFSSVMLNGGDPQDVSHLKGAKDARSIQPYIHLSSKRAKRISRLIK